MACTPSTIAYLREQVATAGPVSARAMFGEYALYLGDKLVALVCDDTLYLKPTDGGRRLIGDGLLEAPPYPGAKPCLVVPGETWEDAELMAALFRVTGAELPPPRKKPVRASTFLKPAASPRRGRRSPGTP